MVFLLTGLHVLVCLFLIFVVLLQSAQAADLAGAFGGGGSQTALGMRGATTLLHKATTGAAVLFMLTSLVLGMTGRGTTSLLEGLDEPATPAEETVPSGETPPPALDDEATGEEGEGDDADPSEGEPDPGEADGSETAEESGEQGDGSQQ